MQSNRRVWVKDGAPGKDLGQEVMLMPGKKQGSSVKNPDTYEALKKKGMPKGRAAAISNAQKNKGQDKGKKKS